MSKRYTILTFIIGKGYEKVHEILNKQDDVEYLLVTDDETLKSDTQQVVYDKSLLEFKTPFERCFRVRYNVFRYCSTDICITIDGSIQVTGTLDKLIAEFCRRGDDICLMPHPLWDDIRREYGAWVQMRGYPVQQAQRCVDFLGSVGYDFSIRGLYQLCFSVKKRSHLTSQIDALAFAFLQRVSEEGSFERLDQTIFSYVINTFFKHIKIMPVSEQVVRSYALQWYWHNSDRKNENFFMTPGMPDLKYVLNKQVECFQLL